MITHKANMIYMENYIPGDNGRVKYIFVIDFVSYADFSVLIQTAM